MPRLHAILVVAIFALLPWPVSADNGDAQTEAPSGMVAYEQARERLEARWNKDRCEAARYLLQGSFLPSNVSDEFKYVKTLDFDRFDTPQEQGLAGMIFAQVASQKNKSAYPIEDSANASMAAVELMQRFGASVADCEQNTRRDRLRVEGTPAIAAAFHRGYLEENPDAEPSVWRRALGFLLEANLEAEATQMMRQMVDAAEEHRRIWAPARLSGLACRHGLVELGSDYVGECFAAARDSDKKRFVVGCFRSMALCALQRDDATGLMERLEEWLPQLQSHEDARRDSIQQVLIALDILGEITLHADRAVELAATVDAYDLPPGRRARWLHRAGRFDEAWQLLVSVLEDRNRSRSRMWSGMTSFFAHALDFEHAERAAERVGQGRRSRGLPATVTWKVRLQLMQGRPEAALEIAKEHVGDPADRSAFSQLTSIFEKQGYPDYSAALADELGLQKTAAELRASQRWRIGPSPDPDTRWVEFREALETVTSEDCQEPDDRGRMSPLCAGVNPADVFEFRVELADRGMLDEAVAHTNWLYWEHQPGHHGGHREYGLGDLHGMDTVLLQHALFDAYEQMGRQTKDVRGLRRSSSRNGELLYALASDATQAHLRSAFLGTAADSRAHLGIPGGPLTRMEAFGHADLAADAMGLEGSSDKLGGAVESLRTLELLRAGRLVEVIELAESVAHEWAAADQSEDHVRRRDMLDALEHQIVMAAAIESPRFALGVLDAIDVELPRNLLRLRDRLLLLVDEPPRADTRYLGERRAWAWTHTVQTLYCAWPWGPTGEYHGVPDLYAQSLPSGQVCPPVDDLLPSDPRDEHETFPHLRRAREVDFSRRTSSVRQTQRELRLAQKMASRPLSKLMAIRVRARGGSAILGPKGHPDIVEAVNRQVLDAVPDHRRARLNTIYAKLNRRPSREARGALLEVLEEARWSPALVATVIASLHRLELWVEIARVVGPELDLAEQWPLTLERLIASNARIGRAEDALEVADAYAETMPDAFRAYMFASRTLEEHGLQTAAADAAARAHAIDDDAPGPVAAMARNGRGEAPDGWTPGVDALSEQLRRAIVEGRDRDVVFEKAMAVLQRRFFAVRRDFDAVWGTIDVFEQAGAARLALEFLETRFPEYLERAPLTWLYAKRLSTLLIDAGRLDEAEAVLREGLTVRALIWWRMDARFLHGLTRLALAREEPADALHWARQAVRSDLFNGPDPRLFYHLGRAQAAAGCTVAAAHTYERALLERGASYERLTPEQEDQILAFVVEHPADITRTTRPVCDVTAH